MEFRRHVAPFLVTLSIVLLTACGGGNDSGGDGPSDPPSPSPSPSPPGSGTGVTVRGTERLTWDQGAPSAQRVREYGFTAYVDGTGVRMTDVQCSDTVGADGYSCSAPLPAMSNGTHVIQVTAIVDAVESQRSAALTVTMNSGRMIAFAAIETTQPPATGGSACSGDGLCVASQLVVTRPAPLSSPALTPDGRLLFVEDGRMVRILADGALTGEPAFTAAGHDARIVALLVDRDFERTRTVRIAWTEQHAARGRVLSIARLREFNNRLGEMAVLVPEIPLPESGDAHVVQDDTGRLYVSVPADRSGGRANDAYAGQVLQFTADGRGWSEGLAPVLARGYEQPGALTFDSAMRRLWVTGSDRNSESAVATIALGDTPATVTAMAAPSVPIVGLALLDSAEGKHSNFLALDAEGSLTFAHADAQAFTPQGRIPFDAGRALSLHGTTGAILMTSVSAGESAPVFSIYRVDTATR